MSIRHPRPIRIAVFAASIAAGGTLVSGCGGDSTERQTVRDLDLSKIAVTPPATVPNTGTAGEPVTDASGAISLRAPAEWKDHDEGDAKTEKLGLFGRWFTVSTDTDRFSKSFSEPGVYFLASRVFGKAAASQADPTASLQRFLQDLLPKDLDKACGDEVYTYTISPGGGDPYSQLLGDIAHTGALKFYPNCSSAGADFIAFALLTNEGTFVHGEAVAPGADDVADVNEALGTLAIDGNKLPAATGGSATGTTTTTITTTATTATTTTTTTTATPANPELCTAWTPANTLATGLDFQAALLQNGQVVAEPGRVALIGPVGHSAGYASRSDADAVALGAVSQHQTPTKIYRWLVLEHSGKYYAFLGRLYHPELEAGTRPPCRISEDDARLVAWHALRFIYFSSDDASWMRYDWDVERGGQFTKVNFG
jgi:hypothetical protein